jgi:hypothetical protein
VGLVLEEPGDGGGERIELIEALDVCLTATD